MTREDLVYANELMDCLDALTSLKQQFVEKECPAVNQVCSTRLTKETLELWKEANITVLDQCMQEVEQTFNEL